MKIDDKNLKLIETTALKLLLEKKRNFIGRHVSWEFVFSGLLFALPLIPTTFDDLWFIPGELYKWILVGIGFILAIIGIVKMAKAAKEKYTQEDLYRDIINLEPPAKRFSLIAIKDTFNEYSNRYLLYYDPKWRCRLFPNFKTTEDEADDTNNIIHRLSLMLHIPQDEFTIEFKAQEIQRKFAPADNMVNTYDHKLYSVTIKSFPDDLKQDVFTIEGKEFFWLSIDDMLKDERIFEINLGVVSFVKDNA